MLINASPVSPETRIPHPPRGDVAIILSGGGARAAYQVGVLRGLSRHFPRARPLILAGESAGAINAAYLAATAPAKCRDPAHDRSRAGLRGAAVPLPGGAAGRRLVRRRRRAPPRAPLARHSPRRGTDPRDLDPVPAHPRGG